MIKRNFESVADMMIVVPLSEPNTTSFNFICKGMSNIQKYTVGAHLHELEYKRSQNALLIFFIECYDICQSHFPNLTRQKGEKSLRNADFLDFWKFEGPISSTKMEKSHHLISQNTKWLIEYLHTLVWNIRTSNQSGLSLFPTSATWLHYFKFPAERRIWAIFRNIL